MSPLVACFIKDACTTAIEYALIGVGISVAILTAVQLVGLTYQVFTTRRLAKPNRQSLRAKLSSPNSSRWSSN